MALTDEQINALNVRLEEFRAADYEDREQIVEDLLGSFKGACPQGVEFERTTLRTVRIQSKVFDCSHTFLAYSAVPLWQGQPSTHGIRIQHPKPGG